MHFEISHISWLDCIIMANLIWGPIGLDDVAAGKQQESPGGLTIFFTLVIRDQIDSMNK